jgi:hypothetical protein
VFPSSSPRSPSAATELAGAVAEGTSSAGNSDSPPVPQKVLPASRVVERGPRPAHTTEAGERPRQCGHHWKASGRPRAPHSTQSHTNLKGNGFCQCCRCSSAKPSEPPRPGSGVACRRCHRAAARAATTAGFRSSLVDCAGRRDPGRRSKASISQRSRRRDRRGRAGGRKADAEPSRSDTSSGTEPQTPVIYVSMHRRSANGPSPRRGRRWK